MVPNMQWNEMGMINLREMVGLKHANGDPNPVTISVFAWAEDVQLSVPTNANIQGLVPQSCDMPDAKGGGADEYGQGPVSKVASTVAKVSGVLEYVPLVAPFAKATTLAAKGIGKLASAFGFSRPNVLDAARPYRPCVMGSLATTNQEETATKLTLDCKQEVTLDSRVLGLGTSDEMDFKSIVARESYYTQFNWAVTDIPGKRLFSTYVEPTIFDTSGPNSNSAYHMLPCGFIALPFKYWGGTMTFRFQVVSSNFHRGRLRVVWDPHDGTGDEYNVMHQTIIDVADARDVSVSVGWGNHYSFIRTTNPVTHLDGFIQPSFTTTDGASTALANQHRGNGVLSVFIVNDLTVPSSDPTINSDVTINVFARMEEDFRFAQPDDAGISGITLFDPGNPVAAAIAGDAPVDVEMPPKVPPGMKLVPQSGDVDPVQESAPLAEGAPDITLGPGTSDPTDETMTVFFGEVTTSIRQLVKRFFYHASFAGNPAASNWGAVLTQPDFPYYQGFNPNGPHVTTTGTYFAYSANTWLNYFTPAFAAYRGGIRRKYLRSGSRYDNPTSNTNVGDAMNMAITRVNGLELTPYIDNGIVTPYSLENPSSPNACGTPSQVARCGRHFYASSGNGTAITSCFQNNALEVELPFYTHRRFFQARRVKTLAPRTVQDEHCGLHKLTLENPSGNTIAYVAAAEDFSLHFFIGVPVFWTVGGGNPNHPIPNS